ncbi:hypothetical protein GCM10020331_034120 [Ectobacillus funiculus]
MVIKKQHFVIVKREKIAFINIHGCRYNSNGGKKHGEIDATTTGISLVGICEHTTREY